MKNKRRGEEEQEEEEEEKRTSFCLSLSSLLSSVCMYVCE
jgi:hypothetical protein